MPSAYWPDFFKHYKDPRDWLTFFRSILQLPGTIANRSTDEIVVELRPPDEPKVRNALALTLAELNALGGRTFGDGQRLTVEELTLALDFLAKF